MYIIAIAWLYVVLLMALTEPSWVAGVATFFFYGVLPLSVLLYLLGTPQRRRNRLRRDSELERTKPSSTRLDPDQ
jgi:membrane protein implicated in regulation of membrane protease activity